MSNGEVSTTFFWDFGECLEHVDEYLAQRFGVHQYVLINGVLVPIAVENI